MKHIGILGGTFDPIHNGHIGLARSVVLNFALDMIYFMPTTFSPLRANAPVASRSHRLKMVQLATEGQHKIDSLDWEINREHTTYTIETAEELHRRFPKIRFYWIIGADLLQSLPKWHRIDELVKLIDFIAVKRPGHPVHPPYIKDLQLHTVDNDQFDISSTKIRERLASGASIEGLVPERVHNYIQVHQLYQLQS